MAINPLQLPTQRVDNSLDFSSLAQLGTVYKQAQKEQKLSDLGRGLADGSIDYRQAAGTLADLGSIEGTFKMLALAEAQKKQADELKAHQSFIGGIGGIFGPQSEAPAVTPGAGGASFRTSNVAPGKVYENDEPSPLDPPSGVDRDRLARTVIAEAGNQGPTGMNAVASVARNRAVAGNYGGDTPSGVVMAPNQFEPWNTAEGRARMAAIDPKSPEYIAATRAIDGAYAGNDPTNGATHFYSPGAQAALGRSAPSWDNGRGVDLGGHRFFGGATERPYQVAGPAVASPAGRGDDGAAPLAPGGSGLGSPQSIRALMGAMANPRLPEADRGLAKTMLEHALKASDLPEKQKNYGFYYAQTVADGRRPDDFTTWDRANSAASKAEVNINERGESEFDKEFGKKQADRWNGYIASAQKAQGTLADIGTMREISRRFGSQGAAVGVKESLGPWAESLGIPVAGLSDIQVYSSIIQKIAPQMHVAGTGSQSDIEFKGLLKSMPQLMANPEAREVILDTMEATQRNELARGDIATQLANKEITRGAAEKKLRELGDPLQNFREWRKANPEAYGQALKSEAPKPTAKFTEEEISSSLNAARAALRSGAPRDAVIKRLRESGLDPSAL